MSPEPRKNPDYWFPAKRYGWGWGLPSNWKGWTVLIAFCVLVAVGAALLLPQHQAGAFVIYCAALSLFLVLVCYITGERPRWRSGSK
jgi:hypothetical protein